MTRQLALRRLEQLRRQLDSARYCGDGAAAGSAQPYRARRGGAPSAREVGTRTRTRPRSAEATSLALVGFHVWLLFNPLEMGCVSSLGFPAIPIYLSHNLHT